MHTTEYLISLDRGPAWYLYEVSVS